MPKKPQGQEFLLHKYLASNLYNTSFLKHILIITTLTPIPLIIITIDCHRVISLLWNDIELSWKLYLPEHLFWIFTYKYGIVVTF